MRPFLLLLAGMFSLLISAPALAADPCPAKPNSAWSAECFVTNGGERRVNPKQLKKLKFNKFGYATVTVDAPREMVAVDRKGVVRIPGILHTGDFDFPYAEDGIGRFEQTSTNDQGKTVKTCGYFQAKKFTIVIPATYDACLPYMDGKAVVCRDCVAYCTQPDCNASTLVGGYGFVLSSSKKLMRVFVSPKLETACAGKPPVRSSLTPTPRMECATPSDATLSMK